LRTPPVRAGDATVGHEIPPGLSVRPRKRRIFGVDLYFREGWDELLSLDADPERLVAAVRQHAVVLLKPDAVAGRRLHAALDWIAGQGMAVVAAEPCRLDRHAVRALWEYQWNIATRERMVVTEAYMQLSPLLVLLVRAPAGPVPATVLVSDRKGPADPAGLRPGQLRHALGSRNYVVNGVHSTDEPADVVRELSVLLTPEQRSRAAGALVGGRAADAGAVVDALYAEVPPVDLGPGGAAAGTSPAPGDGWDRVLADSGRLRLSEDGLARILPGVALSEWA
jgi:nucleoside diphosphate kinase